MKRGFTLIEMLISMVIFSFVIALASYSFRFYAGIVKKIVMPYPENAVKFSYLNDAIDSIFYYVAEKNNILGKRKFFLYFYGEPDEMKFISSKPIGIEDNIAVCRLYVDNNTLFLQESPVYSKYNNYKIPFISKQDEKTIALMKDVSSIKLTYFMEDRPKGEVKESIPNLIEMNVVKDNKRIVFYFQIKSNFEKKEKITGFLYAPL